MTRLYLDTFTMPAADLGDENPLPPLGSSSPSANDDPPAGQPEARDEWYPDKGHENRSLPYRIQDQYNRLRRPRDFKVAVLENDLLKATFLLEVGGRLWSLLHKPDKRELLFSNPVFQPCNLAIRDAWISGGVEWNIGIFGHSPFTCESLFAGRVDSGQGYDVLRLWEWERTRRVPFQIDFHLPPDSPFLFARVRIVNPNQHTVPMYWWSNLAVEERPDRRVLAPAMSGIRHNYDGRLIGQDLPMMEEIDCTYSTRRRSAGDLYFEIPAGNRPWIACLDGQGKGLVHASTSRLKGRKMFAWGVGRGGGQWRDFLSEPGKGAYIEIQAGLAVTQREYVPMPAGARWEWLEAYGQMEAPAAEVHDPNWPAAFASVQRVLDERLPQERLENELQRTQGLAGKPPAEILHQGSGWGALERVRCRVRTADDGPGQSMIHSLPEAHFPDSSLTAEQSHWLALLRQGAMPYAPPSGDAGSLMVQPQWRRILEEALEAGRGDHWRSWFHLGVMRYRADDYAGARRAWERSIEHEPSAWAYHGLACLLRDEGKHDEAAGIWQAARELAPALLSLAIVCCRALLRVNRHVDLCRLAESAPPEIRQAARIRLYQAQAALEIGDFPTVERFFTVPVELANLREGENVLSDLWFELQARKIARDERIPVDDQLMERVRAECPPPPNFDFRMRTEPMTREEAIREERRREKATRSKF